jgi:hypothetical protein
MSDDETVGLSDPAFNQPVDCPTRPELTLGHFEPESINLLAGDPYTGKTRLMLCEANRYRSTGKFLNRRDGRAIPSLIGMICRKHEVYKVQKIIKSCHLDHISTSKTFPIVPLRTNPHGVESIIASYSDFGHPRPSVLFIDVPIQTFGEGNINEGATADAVYARLREFCHDKGVTILVTALTVKRKMNEGYARSAQTVSGSGGWTMSTDVAMFLDLPERCTDETSRNRRLLINAHNDETHHLFLEFFPEGTVAVIATPQDWEEQLAAQLADYPDDAPLSTAQMLLWGADAKISRRNVERWITEMRKAKCLTFKHKGMYTKAPLHRA